MEELRKLEHLSLVSKICTELDNHLGLNDKDLGEFACMRVAKEPKLYIFSIFCPTAEFIIDLAEENSTFGDFKRVLLENGAEFSDSFITNLLRIIQLMKPSGPASHAQLSGIKADSLACKFPGLAIANERKNADDEKVDVKIDVKTEASVADDMMAELESFAPKSHGGGDAAAAVVVATTTTSSNTQHKEEKDMKIVDEKKRERSKERTAVKRSRSREKKRSRSRELKKRSSRSPRPNKQRRERSRSPRDDRGRRGSSRDRKRSTDRNRHRSRSRGGGRRRTSRSPPDRRRRSRSRGGGGRHQRSKSRDRDDSRRRQRSPAATTATKSSKRTPSPMADDPEPGGIYAGRVANTVPFGCFIQIMGLKKRWEGLVHISQLRAEGRVTDVTEVVSRGQNVHVKVMSVAGQKVSLSMKEVDQDNGKDLNPASHAHLRTDTDARDRNPDRPSGPGGSGGGTSMLHLEGKLDGEEDQSRKRVTRISSPERWEIKQMISSGVIDRSELPDFDDETGLLPKDEDDEADIEIEIVEEEPPFLQGHGRALNDLSPVRIVKNPDGSLAQAAMMQSALAKERRELKMLQREQEMDTIPTSLNKNWIDPLPDGKILSFKKINTYF